MLGQVLTPADTHSAVGLLRQFPSLGSQHTHPQPALAFQPEQAGDVSKAVDEYSKLEAQGKFNARAGSRCANTRARTHKRAGARPACVHWCAPPIAGARAQPLHPSRHHASRSAAPKPLEDFRTKYRMRRMADGRLQLRSSKGDWYQCRLDMEVPGSMLLRDPKGNIYAIQTEALQQVCDVMRIASISCCNHLRLMLPGPMRIPCPHAHGRSLHPPLQLFGPPRPFGQAWPAWHGPHPCPPPDPSSWHWHAPPPHTHRLTCRMTWWRS